MDIFEADEQQREEELQKWWKDNWKSIVSGVLIALVAICVFYYYREYREQVKQQSTADFYTIVVQNDGTDDNSINAVKGFIASNSNEYGQLAAIQLAKSYISLAKYQEAYDVIITNIGLGNDDILDNLMRLRAARLAIELKQYPNATAALNAVKSDSFKSAVAELKGDLSRAQGNFKDALAFYKEAMDNAVESVTPILKMKYDSLLTTDGVAKPKSVEATKTEKAVAPTNEVESNVAVKTEK